MFLSLAMKSKNKTKQKNARDVLHTNATAVKQVNDVRGLAKTAPRTLKRRVLLRTLFLPIPKTCGRFLARNPL